MAISPQLDIAAGFEQVKRDIERLTRAAMVSETPNKTTRVGVAHDLQVIIKIATDLHSKVSESLGSSPPSGNVTAENVKKAEDAAAPFLKTRPVLLAPTRRPYADDTGTYYLLTEEGAELLERLLHPPQRVIYSEEYVNGLKRDCCKLEDQIDVVVKKAIAIKGEVDKGSYAYRVADSLHKAACGVNSTEPLLYPAGSELSKLLEGKKAVIKAFEEARRRYSGYPTEAKQETVNLLESLAKAFE